MRTCIFGLGAVGGLIGARLAASGAEVSAIARGATLAAATYGFAGYTAVMLILEQRMRRSGGPGITIRVGGQWNSR